MRVKPGSFGLDTPLKHAIIHINSQREENYVI